MGEAALAVGTLVDYCSNEGETAPAVIAKVIDETFGVVELATVPHLGDGFLSAVPFNDNLAYGCWTWQPKVERKWGELINPYGLTSWHKHWFSASELKAWKLCKRKWWYRYVEKLKFQNRFARRGSATHGFIEGWLKYGISPPEHIREGKLARAGLKHLPPPMTADIERNSRYLTRNGFQYSMGIDVSFRDPDTHRATILDHKTVTDFKWMMREGLVTLDDYINPIDDGTPGLLGADIQGLLYAAEGFIYWDTDEIDLRWLYYKDLKTRPTCKKIGHTHQFQFVENALDAVDAISNEIVLYGLTKTKAEDLPCNGLACEQFGGCPYKERGICGVTDAEILEAYMEQSSIRSRLMGSAGAAPAPAAAAPAPAPAPAAAPAAPAASAPTALSRLRQNAAAAVPQGAAPQAALQAAPQQRLAPQAAPQTHAAPAAGGGAALQRFGAAAQAASGKPAGAPPAAPQQQQAAPQVSTNQNRPAARRLPTGPAQGAPQQQPAPQAAPQYQQPTPQAAPAQDQYLETPATFDETSEHNPADINPPEQPENPIQDAGELEAANAANTPAAPKKGRGPGRPAGSTNVKPVSDEGYIFAQVWCKGFDFATAIQDQAPDELAAGLAKQAVEAFRKL